LDALTDEQDQGITIDTARSFFKTKKRDYIIIDAPGHIEFLKNMISGAARAEAAVLVIDAKEGVRENSRRHGYILSMLGIKQIIICVNKMDLVNYDEAHFKKIEKEYREFLSTITSVSPKAFIPISAVNGENLTVKSAKTPWYKGTTLLEALDTFEKEPPKNNQPLRFPIQAVYKFVSEGDDRRIFSGRIEAGTVNVGDKVVFLPSHKTSTVKSIEGFNTSPRKSIDAGWSTGFTLAEEIYVTRGEIMCHEKSQPLTSTRFRANLIWLSKKPFEMGRDYKLKIHTQAQPVRLHKINTVIDASEVSGADKKKIKIERHDVADIVLETRQTIAFDPISAGEATGRFVIVDGYDIAGGGIIISAESDNQEGLRAEAAQRDVNWIQGGVSMEERATRFKHGPALVMFTGKAGVGKHKFARAVEKSLFGNGMASYMLDGTNVLLGVDADLVWMESTQRELVRRFSEVAHILLNAGQIVVSTTNSIGLADFAAVQALLPAVPILTIEIDPTGTSIAPCDLRLSGTEPEQQVVQQITELLRKNKVINGSKPDKLD
jgi:bifunctional enzyme CysN/CysC